MTANLPSRIAALPPLTPLRADLMPLPERTDHRRAIAGVVEVVLSGYWQANEAEELRAAILRDWCDELENWDPKSVRAALRRWREDNPSRRPNPGHILGILKEAWGKRHADQVRIATTPPEPARDLPSPERRAEIAAEVSRTMASLGKQGPKAIIDAEIAAAATDHDVTEDEIRSYDRRPHVVAARDQVIRAAHERGIHMAEIARVLGRDHSSIIHAIRKGAA